MYESNWNQTLKKKNPKKPNQSKNNNNWRYFIWETKIRFKEHCFMERISLN